MGAAAYVKGEQQTSSLIKTKAGRGVRYVLPQRVHTDQGAVSLFLRVTEPFGKVRFSVTSGDEVLSTALRLKAAPGEMEKLIIPAEKLAAIRDEIIVSLEEC